MRNVSDGSVHSVWKSPVPFLLGGVGAMLVLIAFALVILACSYWKNTSGNQAQHNNAVGKKNSEVCWDEYMEEKIVVIMAGDERPTFLAKPMNMANSTCKTEEC